MRKKILLFMVLCATASFFSKTCDAASKTVTASSKATVISMLELAVSQEGKSEIKFGNIIPSAIDPTVAGPVKVLVDVKSNSGDRYQVIQHINGPLTNGETGEIDPSQLKFICTPAKTTGIGVAVPTAFSPSNQAIFTSDLEGKSDSLTVEYTLIVPPGQPAGNYSALITYTVSTL